MTTEKITYIKILATDSCGDKVIINEGYYKYFIPQTLSDDDKAKMDKIILKTIELESGQEEEITCEYSELFPPQEPSRIIPITERYNPFRFGYEHHSITEDGRELCYCDTAILHIDESDLPEEYRGKVKVVINGNKPFIESNEYVIDIKVIDVKTVDEDVESLRIEIIDPSEFMEQGGNEQ